MSFFRRWTDRLVRRAKRGTPIGYMPLLASRRFVWQHEDREAANRVFALEGRNRRCF